MLDRQDRAILLTMKCHYLLLRRINSYSLYNCHCSADRHDQLSLFTQLYWWHYICVVLWMCVHVSLHVLQRGLAVSIHNGGHYPFSRGVTKYEVCVCLIKSESWSLSGLKHVSLEQPLISDQLSLSEDQGCTLTHQGWEPGQCYLCAGIKVPVFASRSILSTNLSVTIITHFSNVPPANCKMNTRHWKHCCHTLNSPLKAGIQIRPAQANDGWLLIKAK